MRGLTCSLVVLALLGAAPLFAQTKAKAMNVPEIPFDSVPELPEAPARPVPRRGNRRRHQFEGAHLRLHPERRHAALRVRSERRISSVSSARACTGSSSPTRSASTRRTTSGRRRGDEHGDQVQPRGPRHDGARTAARSGRGLVRRAGCHRRPPQPYLFGRPTDVGVRRRRQHLRLGRLRQFARREVRQERAVPRGRRARAAPRPGSSILPHTIATDAKGNVYVGDRCNARMQVFDNNSSSRRSTTRSGNPWAICITPGPHQYLYVSNSNPRQQQRRSHGPSPARSTRWSSTARSSASSASPASRSASSAPCTRSTAATRTSCWCRRSPPGACRRSSCAAAAAAGPSR